MARKGVGTRKFNDKIYQLTDFEIKKTVAMAKAEKKRKYGWYVRVVKEYGVYNIYTRRK